MVDGPKAATESGAVSDPKNWPRNDPNYFNFGAPDAQGNMGVSYGFGGQQGELVMGPPGSQKISALLGGQLRAMSKEGIVGLVSSLRTAYLAAPNTYGTTDSADKYEQMLDAIGKTCNIGRGDLLFTSDWPAKLK